jgi:cruciform cutting endonuclease 1
MALTIPTTLKATALKQIAFKCGISTSGTKAILLQRLQDELPILSFPALKPAKPIRILSIDMGIRNLAFSLLEIPPPKSTASKSTSDASLPVLKAWQKLSLLPQSENNAESKVKNEFTPAILSDAAYELLRNHLVPHSPTLILIERQRFRSMGSKHIFEWTVRVNMLESMLWAILKTLGREGVWDGEVKEVTPGKVGAFWVVEAEELNEGAEENLKEADKFTKVRTGKDAKSKNKGAKIDLVRGWLEEEKVVLLGSEQVKKLREIYVEKWARKGGRIKGRKIGAEKELKAEEVGKLDDLADCLLQGMAWIKWEENRRRVLEEGVEAMLED